MKDPLIALAGLSCFMHIKKAIQIYLEWKKSHTTVAYDRYKIRLDYFMQFVGEETLLSELTGDHVVAYHRHMEATYSPATIAYSARILKNFFMFWHGRRAVAFSPKEIIPVKYTTADTAIVLQDDFEAMDELLDEQYRDDLVKKLVINMLWDTGVRVSELLEMKIGDIEQTGKNGCRRAKIKTKKSMRYNYTVWGAKTNELLNRYLGFRLCLEDVLCDVLLINPKTKKPYTARTLQRWMNELSDQALLGKTITPHSFRHGKANYILEEGGNARDVTALLRHVNPISTFKYFHLCGERYEKTASKFLATT